MPAFQSIADLLRHEILAAPATPNQIARETGILQPPLWRFLNEGTDPKLASAERLLRYFGYVLVKESDAEGLKYVRPAAAPETRRIEQRARNAKAKRVKPAAKPRATKRRSAE